MCAVGDECEGEVAERFAKGHELFGWRAGDGSLPCFVWVCFQQRSIGPQRLRDLPGRAFIYNGHTLAAFRRQGLYTALLRHIQPTLAGERINQIIADVNRRNVVSRRGLDRAGYRPIASLTFVTVLGRWNFTATRHVYDQSGSSIFAV
jgi:hypothetical protein